MGAKRKHISIVEAAYQPATDFDAWVRNACRALTGLFPGPFPAFAIVQRGRRHMQVEAVLAMEAEEELQKLIVEMSQRATAEEVKRLWGQRAGVGTVSELLGDRGHAISPALVAPPGAIGRTGGVLTPFFERKDALGLFFERSDGRIVTFNLSLDRRRSLEPRERSSLARILSHLSLSERLLREGKPVAAIVSADGKVLHAEGDARNTGARAALRAQALRMDRARGRTLSDEDAVALWRGMVEGRWSLVDEFDKDGKRLFVARENVGLLAGSRALTTRERQVLALVLTRRTNKLVAYELGIAPSTVSLCVASILAKTGARDRASLVEVAEALGKAGEKPDANN